MTSVVAYRPMMMRRLLMIRVDDDGRDRLEGYGHDDDEVSILLEDALVQSQLDAIEAATLRSDDQVKLDIPAESNAAQLLFGLEAEANERHGYPIEAQPMMGCVSCSPSYVRWFVNSAALLNRSGLDGYIDKRIDALGRDPFDRASLDDMPLDLVLAYRSSVNAYRNLHLVEKLEDEYTPEELEELAQDEPFSAEPGPDWIPAKHGRGTGETADDDEGTED